MVNLVRKQYYLDRSFNLITDVLDDLISDTRTQLLTSDIGESLEVVYP